MCFWYCKVVLQCVVMVDVQIWVLTEVQIIHILHGTTKVPILPACLPRWAPMHVTVKDVNSRSRSVLGNYTWIGEPWMLLGYWKDSNLNKNIPNYWKDSLPMLTNLIDLSPYLQLYKASPTQSIYLETKPVYTDKLTLKRNFLLPKWNNMSPNLCVNALTNLSNPDKQD